MDSQELLSGQNTTELLGKIHELEEMNRDLMGMIENSYDAMCIADGEGRILLLNPSFERVMGLKNAEIMGRKIPDIVKNGLADNAATIKVLETGKEATVMINTVAGKHVLSTGTPVYDRHGNIFRIYCNLRDVTDLNRLKEQYNITQKLASKYLIELNELKKLQIVQSSFVTRNTRVKQIVDFAYRMAQADSTILILGESGVGKDLIARMIHDASPRNESGEFVKIECGAIPEQLLESELFGYEPGAFTGARKEGKVGYLEIANKGTCFLDEIGDLPKRLQVKLLGTIQDQQIRRVGGTEQTKIDVRIIAATNRDLEQMMLAGEFREDLYYRISVIPIIIPPLRERRDDIPFLLTHYLHHFNTKYDKDVSISNEVLDILSEYDWHGNVRELCNLVERVVLSAKKTLVTISALPEKYKRENVNVDVNVKEFSFSSLKDEVQRYELQLVKGVLSQDSSLEEAASRLKISISSLIRRKRRIDNQK